MKTSSKVFIGCGLLTAAMLAFGSFFVSLLGPFVYFGIVVVATFVACAGIVNLIQRSPSVIPEGDPGYELRRIRILLEESKK